MNEIISVKVRKKLASTVRNPFIVAENTDYRIVFDFDSPWETHEQKTCRLSIGDEYIDVDFTGSTVCIPSVPSTVDHIYVGVYAGELQTTTPARIPVHSSILGLGEGEYDPDAPDVVPSATDITLDDLLRLNDVSAGQWVKATLRQILALAGASVDPSDAAPLMDGTASAGVSDDYARGDHTHPTDTSRASEERLESVEYTVGSIGASVQSLDYAVGQIIRDVDTKYAKPTGGIPKTDLSSGVQSSLGKADTALQAAPVSSVNGQTGAVELDAEDVGALASTGNAYRALSIPYGVVDSTSTSTAFTATVDGITELRDGVCAYIRNGKVTSASGCTLNINDLGAKPIYSTIAAETAVTTTFSVNYTMLFIFNSTRVTGGCWDMYYGYDANTTYTPVKLGFGYATCSTAEATVAKTASISSYALTTGGIVAIKFANNVPANATLNITSKGAKAIYYQGAAITDGVIKAGDTVTMIYSTYYHIISIDRDEAPVSSVNGQTGAVVLSIPSTAADVGAIAAPSSPTAGAFLVWDGTAWTAQTLATWQGGNY